MNISAEGIRVEVRGRCLAKVGHPLQFKLYDSECHIDVASTVKVIKRTEFITSQIAIEFVDLSPKTRRVLGEAVHIAVTENLLKLNLY